MDYSDILVIVISYLLGCINTGYYYVRLIHKEDIRTIGTKVTGAYNVSRISGKKGFIITFIGDALKGALTVLLCRALAVSDIVVMLCILMVLAGHILPFQLKFRGGKGLSTAFGAFIAFNPVIILFWLAASIVFFPLVRRYTVTVLFALMFLPFELFIFDYPYKIIIFFILYAVLIIFACRSNFQEFIRQRAYHGKNNN
jgi:glycerol-3-phosphate acyltransferase PlsY